MKRIKRNAHFLMVAILLSVMFTGCGESSENEAAASKEAYDSYPEEAAYYDDYSYGMAAGESAEQYAESDISMRENGGVLSDDPSDNEELSKASSGRKMIKTVNIDVETSNFDELIENVMNKINALGGYSESTSINGSSYGDTTRRNAYIVARIPSDKLDSFVKVVADNSNVLSRNESVDDVTLNYVDMEAKKKSLQTEYDRLNTLIETAEDLETLIMLEERLSEVRYELESYESRLRTMDNQVAYSTVNMSINEVITYTPTPTHESGVFERMGKGFTNSCKAVVEFFKNLLVGIVTVLPFIALFALIVLIIYLIVFCIIKIAKKNAAKKRERYNKKIAENYNKKNPEGERPQAGKKADENNTGDLAKKPGNDLANARNEADKGSVKQDEGNKGSGK